VFPPADTAQSFFWDDLLEFIDERKVIPIVGAELVTLLLNFSVFSWLVPRVHGLAPELVSFAGTFVVFVSFAYPMRRLVIFKLPP
jgi:hypothetical protein